MRRSEFGSNLVSGKEFGDGMLTLDVMPQAISEGEQLYQTFMSLVNNFPYKDQLIQEYKEIASWVSDINDPNLISYLKGLIEMLTRNAPPLIPSMSSPPIIETLLPSALPPEPMLIQPPEVPLSESITIMPPVREEIVTIAPSEVKPVITPIVNVVDAPVITSTAVKTGLDLEHPISKLIQRKK